MTCYTCNIAFKDRLCSLLIWVFCYLQLGSETELKYKLCGYGVPAELLPMSSTGTIKFDNHRDWLTVIRTKAVVASRSYRDEIVECPRFNDVVYRKGPATKLNAGNSYYRDLIADYSLEHFMADRNKKYEITRLVIQKVEERGGRFLEWKNMWVVFRDQEKIRKKIASAFKQHNRHRKKGESDQLIQTIQIATSIQDDDMFSTDPSLVTSSHKVTSVNDHSGRTRSTADSADSTEFEFLQAPTKRRRIDQDCSTHLFCSSNDDGCLDKCFFPSDDEPYPISYQGAL